MREGEILSFFALPPSLSYGRPCTYTYRQMHAKWGFQSIRNGCDGYILCARRGGWVDKMRGTLFNIRIVDLERQMSVLFQFLICMILESRFTNFYKLGASEGTRCYNKNYELKCAF